MDAFIFDILLSGLTHVVLIFLAFRVLRQRKRGGDDGGQSMQFDPPIIDLPPGISWPTDNSPTGIQREKVLD